MSTIGLPHFKRKRTEECLDVPPAPVNPTVRSEIWYDDGSVILQAEGVQFKVYRGVLAESSSVFSDMFSIPQPTSPGTELLEECHVVHLSDSAEDVRYILEALCQRKYIFQTHFPFPVFAAFLCLGQKYDIPQLYDEARKRAFQAIPTTLDALNKILMVPTDRPAIEPCHMFQLTALARKTGLLSLLPFVLYGCCKLPIRDLVEGVNIDKVFICLSLQDQVACLAGHRAICDAQARTTWKWLHDRGDLAPGCTTKEACQQARSDYHFRGNSPNQRCLGFLPWDRVHAEGLCSACAAVAQGKHEEGSAELWEQLPGFFYLPQWSELLKERQNLE